MADQHHRATKNGEPSPTKGGFKPVNTLASQATPRFKKPAETTESFGGINSPFDFSPFDFSGSDRDSGEKSKARTWDPSLGVKFSPTPPPSATPLFTRPSSSNLTFDATTLPPVERYQIEQNRLDARTRAKAPRPGRSAPPPPSTFKNAMVSERDPSRTSSGAHLSPQKHDQRLPLANISAKMQSPSSKQTPLENSEQPPLKPPTQPEFGKASPLRNPLRKPEPNPFVPRSRPMPQRPPESHAMPQPSFRQPINVPQAQPPQPQFYLHGQVPRPVNHPPQTIQPPPKPTFSSIGPNTYFQPFVPPKPVVDLTKDDEDTFDPDEAIRADAGKFGAADPYMYVDNAQANDNIKNLLEGAFDDEDERSKTRLRTRAKKKKAAKEPTNLASKLAALDVKDSEPEKAEPEEAEEEEEDGTVEGLNVKLLPHQVEGVGWMIDKENGARKKRQLLPHGGILADDMGLGKTIQSVALMLTNPRPGLDAEPEHKSQKMPGKEVGKGTLVVAPLALIKQWEGEIKSRVQKSHAMKVLVHHGPSRTKSGAELKKYDVVITTYQILASEHAASNLDKPGGARVGCFGVHWYRMILDEAHTIKNRNAKSTLACCALESWYRWCLTGTPMQNNLDELQSLIKFLRIKPYCNLPEWKTSITGPMKNGRGGLAMKRLQYFLKAFMKRRTKDILKKDGALNFGGKTDKDGEPKKGGMQIVKREVLTMECHFDEAESEFYDRLQARAENRLKDIMEGAGNDYIGALVILLRLRQACNHPHLIEMAVNKDKDAMSTGASMPQSGAQTPRKTGKVEGDEMDDLAALMGGVSVQTRNCDVCQIELNGEVAKEGKVRCAECDADLAALKKKEKSKSKKVKKEKVVKKEVRREKVAPARRNRRVLEDSDDEEEGEWIGPGPERDIDLGKAGGTDDEDAEGGGETLDSIDSVEDSDNDDEDSPPRAHRRETTTASSDEDDASESEDDKSSASASDSEPSSPILRGLAPSHKSQHKPSTKIRHLLRILHAESPSHKTIVFSQFTAMLDLIEPHLRASNLRFVRYDGSMRPDAREASLASLRNDPKTRVLLCSLKCGSLGLNLTAASRVVIVEPFWNPFVEEQAIDRVHRLNQTVDVKVFRLTVSNTVEEKILALQERKRELAKAAIEGGKAVGKLSMADIVSLFKRDDGAHTEEDAAFAAKFGGDTKILDGERSASSGPVGGGGVSAERVGNKGKARVRSEHEVYGRRW